MTRLGSKRKKQTGLNSVLRLPSANKYAVKYAVTGNE